MTTFRDVINKAVEDRQYLIVPGVYDGLSAKLAKKVGFESMFIGGFTMVGGRYGVPDIGLKGFGEMSAVVRDILAASNLPAIVDCDDGYGDVKNVVHTVQTYERMGATAVMLEDQAWPKRCGHLIGKKVVPAEVSEAKIRAAAAERINPSTWILARTDARAVYDLDEALRRAERYLNAGADGIFVEAPRSVEELERVARAFDVPQMANPLLGGQTPILSPKELGDLGFRMIGVGLDTILHAARAIEALFMDFRAGKFARRSEGMAFKDFNELMGYDYWESVDERYAPEITSPAR